MTLPSHNIPFVVLAVSMVTPWLANLLVSKAVTFSPIFVACALAILSKRFINNLTLGMLDVFVFLLVLFHVLFSIVTGRGIGSGGTLIIYFYSYLFYYLIKSTADEGVPLVILRYTAYLYLFHIFALFIELIIVLAGFQYALIDIGGGKLIVNSYKSYNHADFMHFLGFDYARGLASLLLGSQSASQLTVLAAFVFAPLYNPDYPNNRKAFLLACFLVPFASSQTSLLMLAVLLSYAVYLQSGNKLHNRVIMLILLLVGIIFSSALFDVIFYKLINDAQFDQYLLSFMEPVYRFNSLPLADKIMGEGARGRELLEKFGGEGSDFGLMTLINQTGIYLMGLSFIILTIVVTRATVLVSGFYHMYGHHSLWSKIAMVNVLCLIGWYFSLIHYTTAVEVGGREMFSMHIALCAISINRLSRFVKRSKLAYV